MVDPTHEVFNQPGPFPPLNLFRADVALQEAVAAHGGAWDRELLEAYGALAGGRLAEQGRLANTHRPQLRTHDAFGHRLDAVEFHPPITNSCARLSPMECMVSPGRDTRAGTPRKRRCSSFTTRRTPARAAHHDLCQRPDSARKLSGVDVPFDDAAAYVAASWDSATRRCRRLKLLSPRAMVQEIKGLIAWRRRLGVPPSPSRRAASSVRRAIRWRVAH